MVYFLIAALWLLAVIPAAADPFTIGLSILVNLGYTGGISGLGATLLGSVVIGAGGLLASAVSAAIFAPKATQASPSDRQVTVRQSVGARVRSYGTVKFGGSLWFYAQDGGYLYKGTILNEGEISQIRETWLLDQKVPLDSSGYVTVGPYQRETYSAAQVQYKYGTDDQTAFPDLDAVFAAYTPAHRMRGVALGLCAFAEVPSEIIANVYPQLDPNLRVVMDASLITDVRTGIRKFSENPADAIYDYLVARDGAGFAYGAGYSTDEINLGTFQYCAERYDELVQTRDGGFIKRYVISGNYGLNEQVRDVLPRLLRSCDGDVYLDTDGRISLRGGFWVEPVLTIDDQHIIEAEFTRGTNSLTAFNELVFTYVEPELDYQEVEGQTWIDIENTALVGRSRIANLNFEMVRSHAQARRLAKIHTHKSNPRWSGKFVTDFYGFNAINEQTIRLKYSPLGIDESFLVRGVRILEDLTGVEIRVSSLSALAYEWDAFLEEGVGPAGSETPDEPIDLPPPDDFAVEVRERSLNGSVIGLYLFATWTEPDRTALSQQVQTRELPGGEWVGMAVADGVGQAESGIVNDGSDYEVRIRTRSPAGASGPWIDPVITINASI